MGQEVNLIGARSVESEWWRELKESLPTDCRLLQLNPLYALPRELLDALDKHVGGLLDEDREAERQLAAFCKENDLDGFWYCKPFNYPQLRPHHEDLLDDKHVRGYERQWPLSISGVAERCANVLAPAVITRNRMQGYLGWLVTEPAYRRELDVLRAEGQAVVEETTDIAAFNYIPTEEDVRRLGLPVSGAAALFYESYRRLCQRWCIEGLITWDLPLPRNPDWGTSIEGLGKNVPAEGILLFVPYTFIPHGKVNLSDISASLQQSGVPEQLRGWVDKESEGRMGQAEERFADLFLFQHFLKVIEGRFGGRVGRSKTKIKAALGEFLVGPGGWADSPGKEMVNKLFTLMKKRLELGA